MLSWLGSWQYYLRPCVKYAAQGKKKKSQTPTPNCEVCDSCLSQYPFSDRPDRLRCQTCRCFITDPIVHFNDFHVKEVKISLWRNQLTLKRADTGFFRCPWCRYDQIRNAREIQVGSLFHLVQIVSEQGIKSHVYSRCWQRERGKEGWDSPKAQPRPIRGQHSSTMEGPTPQVASREVKRVTFSPHVTVHALPDFGLQAIEDGTGGIEGEV